MSNLIDRQAALSALVNYIHNVDMVYSTGLMSDADCRDAAESVLGADELPSAQPGCEAWHKTIDEGFPSEGEQVLVTDGKYFWLDESVANDVGLQWESGQSLWERTEWAYFKDLHKKGKSK